jgi:hypothetical protein
MMHAHSSHQPTKLPTNGRRQQHGYASARHCCILDGLDVQGYGAPSVESCIQGLAVYTARVGDFDPRSWESLTGVAIGARGPPARRFKAPDLFGRRVNPGRRARRNVGRHLPKNKPATQRGSGAPQVTRRFAWPEQATKVSEVKLQVAESGQVVRGV